MNYSLHFTLLSSAAKRDRLRSQFLFTLTVFGDVISGSFVCVSCSGSDVGRASELLCLFKVCFA